jgi:hypothetical protein
MNAPSAAEAENPLDAEFASYTRHWAGAAEALGVSMDAIEATRARHRGPWPFAGLVAIDILPGGWWEPREDGIGAIVLPVMDQSEIVDLVAFPAARYRHPLRRTGDAWCLGADNLDAWRFAERTRREGDLALPPVSVFDSVTAWMAHEGRGVCVLDWEQAGWQLADFPHIHAMSPPASGRLREAFARRGPRITMTDRAA